MNTFFNKLKKYLQESWIELKKVNWPNKQETFRLTMKVIGLSLIVALILGIIDYFFSQFIRLLIT